MKMSKTKFFILSQVELIKSQIISFVSMNKVRVQFLFDTDLTVVDPFLENSSTLSVNESDTLELKAMRGCSVDSFLSDFDLGGGSYVYGVPNNLFVVIK